MAVAWPAASTGGEIVVAGKLVIDEVHLLTSPFARGGQTPTSRMVAAGGAPANMAAHLARAGIPVRFVGWAGVDAPTDTILAGLHERDVTIDLVRRGRTPIATVLVEPDGERSMLTDAGDGRLLMEDVQASWCAGAAVVHLDGYNLMPERFPDALVRLAEIAHGCNIPVSLDVAAANRIASYDARCGAGAYRELIEMMHVDMLFVNADEADVLQIEAAPFPFVCIHRGARPTVVLAGSDRLEVPVDPLSDTERVDTTGCGDAFAAGLLAGWRAGIAVEASVQQAHAWARRTAQHPGAQPPA